MALYSLTGNASSPFHAEPAHKQRVRSLMVRQPTITIEGMRRHLAAQDLPLDRGYIASLVKAIQTERIRRADTWTLNLALTSFQDVMTEIVERACEIVNDPMAERSDRLAALREIRAAHNEVFGKPFDAGVFERKLGTLGMAAGPAGGCQASRASFNSLTSPRRTRRDGT